MGANCLADIRRVIIVVTYKKIGDCKAQQASTLSLASSDIVERLACDSLRLIRSLVRK